MFVDEYVPDHSRDAGSGVILSHMSSFRRLGFRVALATVEKTCLLTDTERHKSFHGFYTGASCVEHVLKIAQDLNVTHIYLHRLAVASTMLRGLRKQMPAVALIYNLADLHWLRMRRMSEFYQVSSGSLDASVELDLIGEADAVISHSEAELDLIHSSTPKLILAPWNFKMANEYYSSRRRKGMCFVGNFRHLPNIDAAKLLYHEVFPALREVSIELFIAGSDMPPAMHEWSEDGFNCLGHVETVEDLFKNCRLSLAPLRFGAGIKGKVVASFAARLPCILSPVAAEGLPLEPSLRRSLVSEGLKDFAQKAIALYRDDDLLDEISGRCGDVASRYFNEDRTDLAMANVINLSRQNARRRLRNAGR